VLEHLAFARREQVELGLGLGCGAGEGVEHEAGESR
jgi:hypothetical protein